MQTLGGGKDWGVQINDSQIIDKNEEAKAGDKKEIEYVVDQNDKNWSLMEQKITKQLGYSIVAEVCCTNDHAHLGYIIDDSKALKTGLGKKHFRGPHHIPVE